MRSAVLSLTPRMPRPPAFETAATSSGEVGPLIPARTMGWSIPMSSVNLVLIMLCLDSHLQRQRRPPAQGLLAQDQILRGWAAMSIASVQHRGTYKGELA